MAAALLALAGLATLAGCAAPLPPLAWVRLPLEAPGPVPPVATVAGTVPVAAAGPAVGAAGAAAPVWQLMLPVPLPGHLDREALLVPRGSAGLQALGQLRWAEPLRDAVPRLLRQDLSRALAAVVWQAPLPPGVVPNRQLRVELLALDVTPGAQAVLLRARASVADSLGRQPPRSIEVALEVPLVAPESPAGTGLAARAGTQPGAAPDTDALLAAHRLALQRLAQQLAALALASP